MPGRGQVRGKRKWFALLAIYPGPSHAGKSYDVLLAPVLKELVTLMQDGMTVVDPAVNDMYKMFVYVGMISADTPARNSLGLFMPVAGYRNDWRTTHQGSRVKKGTMVATGSHNPLCEEVRYIHLTCAIVNSICSFVFCIMTHHMLPLL
jgi:hypothetical protein